MSGCTGACHSGGGCTCTTRRSANAFLNLDTGNIEPEPDPLIQPFTQAAYNQITGNLDSIMTFMMTEFGKTETEARAWLWDFITKHYFPVWRALNKKDIGHAPRTQAQPPA